MQKNNKTNENSQKNLNQYLIRKIFVILTLMLTFCSALLITNLGLRFISKSIYNPKMSYETFYSPNTLNEMTANVDSEI